MQRFACDGKDLYLHAKQKEAKKNDGQKNGAKAFYLYNLKTLLLIHFYIAKAEKDRVNKNKTKFCINKICF